LSAKKEREAFNGIISDMLCKQAQSCCPKDGGGGYVIFNFIYFSFSFSLSSALKTENVDHC